MCSKDINFTQNLDLFGETLFFYPVANTFSQTGCQIPPPNQYKATLYTTCESRFFAEKLDRYDKLVNSHSVNKGNRLQ